MTTLLEGLKQLTAIVADAGDIQAIGRLQPDDPTCSHAAILRADDQANYLPGRYATVTMGAREPFGGRLDHALVASGVEVLGRSAGRASTQVGADLSLAEQYLARLH